MEGNTGQSRLYREAWGIFWERDDKGNHKNLLEETQRFKFQCPLCDHNRWCGNSIDALHDLQELAIKHIIGHIKN